MQSSVLRYFRYSWLVAENCCTVYAVKVIVIFLEGKKKLKVIKIMKINKPRTEDWTLWKFKPNIGLEQLIYRVKITDSDVNGVCIDEYMQHGDDMIM